MKFALALVASLALGSTPALANETATSTQMSGVIEAPSGISGGAREFRELFASWEELDKGGRADANGLITPAPRTNVSVPSRMPVEGVRLTSSYGMRDHPILRQRRQHNGVDLAAEHGTPVYATADGRVGKALYWGSYGNYVQIEHGGQLQTRYAHLSSYTVNSGDQVRKGQLIGYIGSTGRSTGPHLHYEVRVEGEPVDPVPYMVASYAGVEQGEGGRGGPE
jgi:murein DD-endopeptidase MepM/ murein hydrolase activator NlpD